ncbi:MAG: Glu/Leu/Phe/Val dehydrogenase [Sphingomonadales bacterium]|nr:Glu/Leu/Phe/Val dehydrogenase [Sphingomonadales bacterium]
MTSPWDMPDFDDHEALHLMRDAESGLSAIIAIHSTHLGPAGGGTRFWHYADSEAAITDALRLSRGMSYKNAMAGLAMGGGKAVILSDAKGMKSPEMISAFARAIDSLGGRYVTAQDVGMSAADMVAISQGTRYVSGLPPKDGGAGGDPGPTTAMGVFLGVKAAVRRALGKDDLAGVHIAIQGVGSVGGGVARHAAAVGARITLADKNGDYATALATEIGAQIVSTDEIMSVEADVFCPCALGAILTEHSISKLRAAVVAGGANNQLATPADGDRLQSRGILYAPDYVINAGGIINVALEYLDGADRATVDAKVLQIPDRLNAVWDGSEASGQNPARVADAMAQRLIGRG